MIDTTHIFYGECVKKNFGFGKEADGSWMGKVVKNTGEVLK